MEKPEEIRGLLNEKASSEARLRLIPYNGSPEIKDMVRAYVKGLWDPTKNALNGGTLEGNDYYDYIKLCTKLGSIKAPLSYSAHEGFVGGKLGFLEVTGKEIRKLSANKAINFNWTVIPFPDLTTADYAKAAAPSVRGTAGLATTWFVTKAAEDKGTTAGCIDLLRFLTAPKQNNRMIGDLKGGSRSIRTIRIRLPTI